MDIVALMVDQGEGWLAFKDCVIIDMLPFVYRVACWNLRLEKAIGESQQENSVSSRNLWEWASAEDRN